MARQGPAFQNIEHSTLNNGDRLEALSYVISVNSAFTSFRHDRPRSPAVLAPVAAGQLLKNLASLRLGVFALKPACTPAELR
jgi:hypothetical protein